MLAGETTCRVPGETAGYWAPAGLPNGVRVKPGAMRIGMASDPRGVVAVGTTHGAFEGQTNAGDRDVFLVRIALS
jgi:hypothetical protein